MNKIKTGLVLVAVAFVGCDAPREPLTPSVYFRETGTPDAESADNANYPTLEQAEESNRETLPTHVQTLEP